MIVVFVVCMFSNVGVLVNGLFCRWNGFLSLVWFVVILMLFFIESWLFVWKVRVGRVLISVVKDFCWVVLKIGWVMLYLVLKLVGVKILNLVVNFGLVRCCMIVRCFIGYGFILLFIMFLGFW